MKTHNTYQEPKTFEELLKKAAHMSRDSQNAYLEGVLDIQRISLDRELTRLGSERREFTKWFEEWRKE